MLDTLCLKVCNHIHNHNQKQKQRKEIRKTEVRLFIHIKLEFKRQKNSHLCSSVIMQFLCCLSLIEIILLFSLKLKIFTIWKRSFVTKHPEKCGTIQFKRGGKRAKADHRAL